VLPTRQHERGKRGRRTFQLSEDILLPLHGIVNEYNRRRRARRGTSNTRKHNDAQTALAQEISRHDAHRHRPSL